MQGLKVGLSTKAGKFKRLSVIRLLYKRNALGSVLHSSSPIRPFCPLHCPGRSCVHVIHDVGHGEESYLSSGLGHTLARGPCTPGPFPGTPVPPQVQLQATISPGIGILAIPQKKKPPNSQTRGPAYVSTTEGNRTIAIPALWTTHELCNRYILASLDIRRAYCNL